MPYQDVQISALRVNRTNDRHGELENETAAIAELFRLHDARMRNLAADIVEEGAVYDPPLVLPSDDLFIVFDGNRRVTCIKLILEPNRAPTQDLQQFFRSLHDSWQGNFPTTLTCQVETDRDVIDAILHRRHTGTQKGIGQIGRDDRAKLNFAERTGRDTKVNVPAEVKAFLEEEARLPQDPIPWSTLRRLLSSEDFRNRVGISAAGNEFRLTHEREAVADALERITSDLAAQRITLGHLLNNEGKRAYLNELEEEGILPTEAERLPQPQPPGARPRAETSAATRKEATYLRPCGCAAYSVDWGTAASAVDLGRTSDAAFVDVSQCNFGAGSHVG